MYIVSTVHPDCYQESDTTMLNKINKVGQTKNKISIQRANTNVVKIYP